MIVYKISFDENRRIYFLIKEEKVFFKYMEILEKFSNISKNKFNGELIYSKGYLRAQKKTKKHTHTQGSFICTNNTD